MKKAIIYSIAALAMMMAACTSDEPSTPHDADRDQGIPFSATITTDAPTRALTENASGTTIDAAWATGEKVALVYGDKVDVMEVTKNDDGTATISGTLTGSPTEGSAVTVIYPASAVDATTKAVRTNLLTAQDGLFTTIAANLDLRQSSGATFIVGANHASLNGTVALATQLAIVKFSLTDGTNAIAAKSFDIKDGSDNVITTVTPSPAASEFYVAMAPASVAEFHFEASDGDFTYTYEKSGVTLAAATYYQSPITMAVVAGTMEVTASGYSGTYDKSAHGITVTAPSGAVVMYGTTMDEYNLDASPEYTNAGNYTVYYQVTKEKYTTVTGYATVSISKAEAQISYTVASISKTYGDQDFTNELTNTGDGAVTYESSNTAVAEVDSKSGKVTIKSDGSTTIKATVTDGDNYTYATKTASYALGVGTATMTVTASGYSGTYDNQPHSITVTAPSGATVMYGTASGTYNLSTNPSYTDAGTYIVYYQVTKPGFTTVTGSATVTISQATGSISFANDAVSQTLSATAANNTYTQGVTKTGDGSVTYSISNNTCGASVDASTGKVTFTQAGSVTVTATVADSQNYTYATKTVSYTLTVKDTTDTNGGIPDNDDYGDGGNPF